MTEVITDRLAGAKKALQIIQAHAECVSMEGVNEAILRKVNKARECGLYLAGFVKDYKEQPIYDDTGSRIPLKALFSDGGNSTATFPFAYMTSRRYIRFFEANPDEITSLDAGVRGLYDAMIACEAIAAPEGHGKQQPTSLTLLDKFTLKVQGIFEIFNAGKEKEGGLAAWPITQLRAFDDRLSTVDALRAEVRAEIERKEQAA